MFINNINSQNNHINISDGIKKDLTNSSKSNNFMKYMQEMLEKISDYDNHANENTKKFTLNMPNVSLNNTMIDIQKSSIALQMAIQIRNKVMTAYQEIINQPV